MALSPTRGSAWEWNASQRGCVGLSIFARPSRSPGQSRGSIRKSRQLNTNTSNKAPSYEVWEPFISFQKRDYLGNNQHLPNTDIVDIRNIVRGGNRWYRRAEFNGNRG